MLIDKPNSGKIQKTIKRPDGAHNTPGTDNLDWRLSMADSTVPYGYCKCGCGQKTKLSPLTRPKHGWVKGQPLFYIKGHSNKISGKRYKVDDNGCWIWQGPIAESGYGMASTTWAHRHVWQQHNGEIPSGVQLHHICEVKSCVNPSHLELLTVADHRMKHGGVPSLRTFSEEAVRAIRRSRLSCEKLGQVFKASNSTIHLIRTRKTYKEIA